MIKLSAETLYLKTLLQSLIARQSFCTPSTPRSGKSKTSTVRVSITEGERAKSREVEVPFWVQTARQVSLARST